MKTLTNNNKNTNIAGITPALSHVATILKMRYDLLLCSPLTRGHIPANMSAFYVNCTITILLLLSFALFLLCLLQAHPFFIKFELAFL